MKKYVFLFVVLCVLVAIAIPVALAGGPIEGRAGRAEVRFLEGMIDHHQMAVDMAQHCLAKAQSESVLTKCQQIIDAQTAEIETMRGWLLTWYNVEYAPMPMSDHMAMMDMMNTMTVQEMMDMMAGMDMSSMTMQDMMTHMMEASGEEVGGMDHSNMDMGGESATDMPMMMGMMAGLDLLEGTEYEIAWLEAMIDHHDDALHMSERILELEIHPETAELAQQIIADQQAEIEEMEAMITELNNQ